MFGGGGIELVTLLESFAITFAAGIPMGLELFRPAGWGTVPGPPVVGIDLLRSGLDVEPETKGLDLFSEGGGFGTGRADLLSGGGPAGVVFIGVTLGSDPMKDFM